MVNFKGERVVKTMRGKDVELKQNVLELNLFINEINMSEEDDLQRASKLRKLESVRADVRVQGWLGGKSSVFVRVLQIY